MIDSTVRYIGRAAHPSDLDGEPGWYWSDRNGFDHGPYLFERDARTAENVHAMDARNIGQDVEDLYIFGLPHGQPLKPEKREGIIAFALRFEECSHDRKALEALADSHLIQAAYWAMSDYAKGQR